MRGSWQTLIRQSVSPLDEGARGLQVVGLRSPHEADVRPNRTAAVLVGILDRSEPEIVLTRRALHLENHAGQVSFPGGAASEGDETGVATALREAEEEIGLPPAAVRPLGFLDRVDTISDFRVLPVVALLDHDGPWQPDRSEVEEVFTLPLHRALDLQAWSERDFERDGLTRRVYLMDWHGRRIWGITAAILVNLAERCARVGLPS